VKSYDSEGATIAYSLGRLKSGGLYFGGAKEFHLVLHTTDVNGNPTWDKHYRCPDIPGFINFAFATIDSSGNYFVSTDGTGIGLLDETGNVIRSMEIKNAYAGMYCLSIGVLPDNKKILLLKDQMATGRNGYAVVCLSPDLSMILWTRYFFNYNCTFLTMDVLNNNVFIPGWVDGVATVLRFDGKSGNVLSSNSYKNNDNHTFFDKIYRYDAGYIVLGRRYEPLYTPHSVIMRLDKNLNVINAYDFNEVWQNTVPVLAVEADGSYYGAWGDEMSAGSYSFEMSKDDQINWSIFNSSINYRPKVFCNMPEGLTQLTYGFGITNSVNTWSLIVARTHKAGRLFNCPSSDAPLSLTNVNYEKSVSAMIPVDTSFITLYPTPMLVSNDTYDLVEVCQNTSNCNSLTITGNTNLCSLNGATFIVQRNKECNEPITWTINNDAAVQTKINDSTVSIRFPGTGTYTLIARLNGCKLISDTVQVYINSSMQFLDLGRDTTICNSNTLLLNAHKGFSSYLWQNGSTDSVFTVTKPGKYFVTTTDACGGKYSDTIVVNQHPPVFFSAGPDRIKCNNDTIHLHATAGFLNYEWLPNYHINATTSADLIVNPLSDTKYTVKAEKTPGCFVFDTVHVQVNHFTPVNLGADTSICLGESVIFNAGNDFLTYTWNNGSNASSITVSTAGKYFVDAVSAEGCHSQDTVDVKRVFSNPVVTLDHNNNLCTGSTRLLDAGNFSSYLWNDGSHKKTLLVSKPGMYSVTVTDKNNCKGKDTIFITNVLPAPTGFLPGDTSACSYQTLVLQAKPGFTKYLWSNNATSRL
jgi:hypothetical protein